MKPGRGQGLVGHAVRGAAWLGASSLLGQAFSLGTTVVLARLLPPGDFGRVAIANLMLAFLYPLHDSGLTAAFVARRDDVRASAATLTWSTPVSGVLAWLVTAATAPLVARLFEDPSLVPLVRVLGFTFVLRGLAAPALAVLSKELAFRARSMVLLLGGVTEGVVGIACAFGGAGAWSLVAGQLAGATAVGVGAWALAPWWPTGGFSFRLLRELSRYGRHLVAANSLGFLGSYLDNILVGRVLGSAALGVYGAAFRWGRLPAAALATVVSPIAFPSYVAVSDDAARLRSAYLRLVRTVTSVSFPASLGLFLVAPLLVQSLYSTAWQGMIEPLRIFAIFGLINSVVATTGDVFKACDRPGWIAGLAAVHLPLLVVLLAVLVQRGPSGAATALTLAATASGAPAMVAVLRILGIRARALLAAIGPQAGATALMGVAVSAARVALRDQPPPITLGVVVPLGALVYLASLFLLDGAWVRELRDTAYAAARGRGRLLA